jgi:FixJ family two-component response regulator
LSDAQWAAVSKYFVKSGLEAIQVADPLSWRNGEDFGRCGCVVAPLPRIPAEVRRFVNASADRESPLRVIFLAEQAEVEAIVEAIRSGAGDVLAFPASEAAFQAAIEVACRESRALQTRNAARAAAREKLARLSAGERDVLELMLAGKVNKSVASRLGIALRTVENRRKQIFTKLGTRSLAEIVHLVRLVQGVDADDAGFSVAPLVDRQTGWDRAAG